MTYKQFCNRYGVKVGDCVMVDRNPHMDDFEGYHYKVKLVRRDPTNGISRQYTLFFSVGTGWSREPNAVDIMECLASDSYGIDRSFEEWADELGMDTDSRKAERTYKAVQKQNEHLERFLGTERLAELQECEE